MLRTTFRWAGLDEPLQDVWSPAPIAIDREDWCGSSFEEREARFEGFLESDRKRGFNLGRGPLSRLRVFQFGQSEHRFVWTFPHALMDGRSFPVVLREAFDLYDAPRRQHDLDLAPPPPFREFIRWLSEKDHSKSEAYWREKLRGFTTPTTLAIERTNAHDRDGGRGEEEIQLPASLAARLREFVERHDLTVNTMVQAAWARLLNNLSGVEDIVFGVTRACRHSTVAGADSMVGLLINTLPIRVTVSADLTLLGLLKAIRADQIAVREHEHTPLLDIQRWSEVPKGRSLFESILVFDHADLGATMRRLGVAGERRTFRLHERTSYPLTLYAYAEPELSLKLAYDRNRFTDGSMRRTLGYLRALLEGMVSDPDRKAMDVAMLTDRESRQLLVEWNQTQKPYPPDATIPEMFEAQVRRTPDRIAVIGDKRLTYRELDMRANQLARSLQARGVGPDVLVGVCMDRSAELLVALMGILKAGGAYVPLDPTYPAERIRFMVGDATPAAILTLTSWSHRFGTAGTEVVCLDREWAAIGREDPSVPRSGASGQNLAYVMYTSGSTGQAKGVMITHRNLVNCFVGIDGVVDPGSPGTWLAVTSISFDISVLELFWTLTRGFTVVLQEDRGGTLASSAPENDSRKLDFSLFYFASNESDGWSDKYRLLLEGAFRG